MTLQVVVGGQYGSEGKGAIAAYLSAQHRDGLVIRVAGPNAGHTVIGHCPAECPAQQVHPAAWPEQHLLNQHPWRLRQVPVAAVSNPRSMLGIAAGSEVDLEVLTDEIRQLDSAGYAVTDRLIVDSQGTILEVKHRADESRSKLTERIGSTGKGIGAARSDRIMRTASLVRNLTNYATGFPPFSVVKSVADVAATHLRNGGQVLIEGTQGYHLGLHAGYYPQCTSSDCTATDFLAMAGLSPWLVPERELEIWVVFRTYPIRVAGHSGPLMGETTWGELGLQPELTTVTRKERRVGRWNGQASRRAMEGNGWSSHRTGPVRAALTMADYEIPGLYGYSSIDHLQHDKPDAAESLFKLLAHRSSDLGAMIDLVGTSPSTVIDLRSHRPL